MHPTLPNLPGRQSKYLLSKFTRSVFCPERFLVILSCHIDEFSPALSVKSDTIQPLLQKVLLAPWRFPICHEVLDMSQMTIAFHRV